MQAHYDSYRSSVQADALEGWVDFAKTCEAHDYLKSYVERIKEAIAAGDRAQYVRYLSNHQDCLLKVFTEMVKRDIAARSTSRVPVLDMIYQRGWKWFKFYPDNISMGKSGFGDLTWIPRYVPGGTQTGFIFDANELEVLFKANPSKEKMAEIAKFKEEPLKLIAIEEGKFHWHPIRNSEEKVTDWTWPVS